MRIFIAISLLLFLWACSWEAAPPDWDEQRSALLHNNLDAYILSTQNHLGPLYIQDAHHGQIIALNSHTDSTRILKYHISEDRMEVSKQPDSSLYFDYANREFECLLMSTLDTVQLIDLHINNHGTLACLYSKNFLCIYDSISQIKACAQLPLDSGSNHQSFDFHYLDSTLWLAIRGSHPAVLRARAKYTPGYFVRTHILEWTDTLHAESYQKLALIPVDDDSLIVYSAGSFFHLHDTELVPIFHIPTPPNQSANIFAVNSELWCGTSSGLFRLAEGVWLPLQLKDYPLPTPVQRLLQDSSGRICIAASQGIYCQEQAQWLPLIQQEIASYPMVLFDAQGGLWYESQSGALHYAQGEIDSIVLVDGQRIYPTWMTLSPDGSLWIQSNQLNWFKQSHGVWESITPPVNKKHSIVSLVFSANGTPWALIRPVLNDYQTIKLYRYIDSKWIEGIPNAHEIPINQFRGLARIDDHIVAFGSQYGVAYWDELHWQFHTLEQERTPKSVFGYSRAISVDQALWRIGNLSTWDDSAWTTTYPLIQIQNGQFTEWTSELLQSSIYSIVNQGDSLLWIASDEQLISLRIPSIQ